MLRSRFLSRVVADYSMVSNFLGDIGDSNPARSLILSYSEVLAREGHNLQKGMHFKPRSSGQLSVFVIFAGEDAPHKTLWHEDSEILSYDGHDVTTAGKDQKHVDQQVMYADGKPTDNGKFFKEATAFTDGIQKEPLQIQVYEKLDQAVFYDKGIFNLVDAKWESDGVRKVCRFFLAPADGLASSDAEERMMPIDEKVAVWERDRGRCAECGEESGLHFGREGGEIKLLCTQHLRRKVSLL